MKSTLRWCQSYLVPGGGLEAGRLCEWNEERWKGVNGRKKNGAPKEAAVQVQLFHVQSSANVISLLPPLLDKDFMANKTVQTAEAIVVD